MSNTSLDPLTGVEGYGRIGTVRRGSAIAYVDLRGFRDRVNGPYGHPVGDHALRAVAQRLHDGLAPFRVFRAGGDEFLIEVDQPLDEDGASDLARRIAELVAQPIDGIDEPLEAWVGITLRRVADDVVPVWIEAARAAHVLAPRAGLPFVVVSGWEE